MCKYSTYRVKSRKVSVEEREWEHGESEAHEVHHAVHSILLTGDDLMTATGDVKGVLVYKGGEGGKGDKR